MKVETFTGKEKDKLLEETLKNLNLEEKNVIYHMEEEKGGLFKSKTYTLKLVTIENVKKYLIKYLEELTNNMNLEVKFESKIREEQITIKMYSDNNSILIGKDGRTLTSIQMILRQLVFNEIGKYPYIILDVENYKEKQLKNLEYTAKKIAKEVQLTKIDAKLENMNSFQRRTIHNVLTNFKNIQTVSEGEDPNRHIIIKYKD